MRPALASALGGLGVLATLVAQGCGPKHDYPDGRGIVGQLEREVIALRQKVSLLEVRAATCSEGGPPDPVHTQLVQIFQGSEVEVSRFGPNVILTAPTSLLLTPELRVRDESAKVLDLLGMALSMNPDYTVLIEVHTSDASLTPELRRQWPDDWALAYAQARAVQRELSARYQVPEVRFTLASRSRLHPVASNDTPAGQRRNERVVITLSPPIQR